MSELPIQQGGLRVLSGIVPASSASTYGTHYSYLGVGGYVEVPNIDYRNSIPPDSNMNDEGYSTGRRRYGMMVYVIDEDKLYRLFPFSGGSVVSMETFTGTSELNQVTMLSNNNGWIEVPDLSVLITGGTYFSGNSSIVLYDSTGGTVSITGITTTDIINPGDGRVLVSTGNSENIFVAQSNMVFNGTNLNITGGTFITDSGGSLHSSAIIQFKSTTKGVLLPGMTTSQKNAIVNPTTGLTVYDSTIEDISVYTSSGWTGVIAERDNLQKVTERGNSTNSGLIISGTTYLVGSGSSSTSSSLLISNSANTLTSQFTDDGKVYLAIPASGSSQYSVGIGTQSPQAILHVLYNFGQVVRNERISDNNSGPTYRLVKGRGSLTGPTAVLVNDGLGDFNWQGYHTSGSTQATSSGTYVGYAARVSANAIENWSSTQRGARINFEVNQSGTTTNVTVVNMLHNSVNIGNSTNPLSATLGIKSSGSTSGLTLRIVNSSNTDTLRILDSGNVLIGTTTDGGEKLYVNGNTSVNGNLQILNNGGLTFYNGASIFSSHYITTSNELLTANSNNSHGAWKFNNYYVSIAKNLAVGTTLTDFVAPSQTFLVLGSSVFSGSVISSGVTRLSGQTSIIGSGTTSGSTAFSVQNSTGGTLLNLFNNGNLNVDNGSLYVDGDNGRVGIGTTTPETTLHLYNSANVDVAATIESINARSPYLLIKHPSRRYRLGANISVASAFEIYDENAASSRFIINTNGNITINTTTDAGFKLDVVGADSRFNGVRVGLGAGGVSTNTVVGSGALNANTTGSQQTAVGYQAGFSNTSGTLNTALGTSALYANTTGNNNTAVGRAALFANITGIDNVAVGLNSLVSSTSGSQNVAIGRDSLYFNTASNNTAVGYQAGYSNTSGGITALGYQAGYSNTSGSLIAIGYAAGNKNTTGTSNIFIGVESGYFNTTGTDNIGIGTYALNNGGSQNIAIGRQTLFNNTANNNIAIGYQAGFSGVPNTTGANNIFIGYQSTGVLATESNRTWIGNSSTTSTWLAGNVLVGTTTDAGYKLNVNGTVKISSTIYLGGNTDMIDPSSNSGFMTIGSNQPIRFTNASSTEFLRIATSGNVLIGTTTDFGYKLDVSGTTRVVSTGSTSGSTTLTLQNSTGRTTTEFRSDGVIGISSASTFTTQVTSVISASTTNSGIAIVPNGTGAFTLNIPDGTATGGNARGNYAVDLQLVRSNANHVSSGAGSFSSGGENRATGTYSTAMGNVSVASGNYSLAIGLTATSSGVNSISLGNANTASSNYSTVSGGQSNVASTGTHATVIGGQSNTASGQYSVAGGTNNNASGQGSITIGYGNSASGNYSLALGIYNSASAVGAVALGGSGSGSAGTGGNTASGIGSFAVGQGSSSYLYGQNATAAYKFAANGDAQQSLLTSRAISAVTSGGTVTLSLDGSGTANLIIPNGNNRAWNVVVNTITVCTVVSGGTLTVGDAHAGEYKFLFKRVGGTSTISPITTSSEVADTSMATASFSFSAGTSQQMAITFNSPNTANNSTFRAVAKVALTEVAW